MRRPAGDRSEGVMGNPERCVDCGVELSPEVLATQLDEILAPFVGTEITPESREQIKRACRLALSPFYCGASYCCRCAWEISEVIPGGATCPFWISMKRMGETQVTWGAHHPWLYDPRTLISWRVGSDQPVSRSAMAIE